MGSPDLVESIKDTASIRIRNIANEKAKLYSKRFFLEVDDRLVEQWLDLIETADTRGLSSNCTENHVKAVSLAEYSLKLSKSTLNV